MMFFVFGFSGVAYLGGSPNNDVRGFIDERSMFQLWHIVTTMFICVVAVWRTWVVVLTMMTEDSPADSVWSRSGIECWILPLNFLRWGQSVHSPTVSGQCGSQKDWSVTGIGALIHRVQEPSKPREQREDKSYVQLVNLMTKVLAAALVKVSY